MNKDRIMELTEILNNPDLHGYLPNVCNELLQVNIDLQKQVELGETYKKLYGEVKKQKDDVVEYIKSAIENDDIEELKEGRHLLLWNEDLDKLLRMLGEIDE